MQKAALISVFVHIFLFLFFLLCPNLGNYQKELNDISRPVIVDFVKIGPKSAAPSLGPQTIQQKGSSFSSANTKKTEKASSLKKNTSISQNIKKRTSPSKKNIAKGALKNALSQQKKFVTSPPKTSSKKQINPQSSKNNSKKGVQKAKVDLSKKGNASQSVDDFLGKTKTQGNHAQGAFAETYGEELTGTDLDVLNRHMKRFWNMPSGHEKAYNIIVEVELFIRPDGSVEKANLVDLRRFKSDSEFRIAAESALRAILDPDCSPLPLDSSKYDLWKHMIFVFDPREMCR